MLFCEEIVNPLECAANYAICFILRSAIKYDTGKDIEQVEQLSNEQDVA